MLLKWKYLGYLENVKKITNINWKKWVLKIIKKRKKNVLVKKKSGLIVYKETCARFQIFNNQNDVNFFFVYESLQHFNTYILFLVHTPHSPARLLALPAQPLFPFFSLPLFISYRDPLLKQDLGFLVAKSPKHLNFAFPSHPTVVVN